MLASKPHLGLFEKLFPVVGDPAAGSAQGERRPHDHRIAHFLCKGFRIGQVVDNKAFGHPQVDVCHCVPEKPAILGLFDNRGVSPDHLHSEFLKDARLGDSHSYVEGRLSSQCGEQGIRMLAPYDLCYRLGGYRLHIGAMRRFRIGHDRGGIAVEQDYFIAIFTQGLAGLCPGVVELACLAYDDRSGAEEQYFLYVCAFGHELFSLQPGSSSAPANWLLPLWGGLFDHFHEPAEKV